VITPEGIKEPGYKRNRPTTVKEYGAVLLLLEQNKDIIEGLKRILSRLVEGNTCYLPFKSNV